MKKKLLNGVTHYYRKLSLRKKLWVSFACVINIPLVIILAFFIKTSTDAAVVKSAADSVFALKQVASGIDNMLGYTVNTSRILVSNSLVQEYYAPNSRLPQEKEFEQKWIIKMFLDNIIEPKSDIASIVLYGKDGNNIGSGRVIESKLENYFVLNSPHIGTLDENWGAPIYIDTRTVSYEYEKAAVNYISILKPVIAINTGAICALAEINYREEAFSAFFDKLQFGKTGVVYLCDFAGNIISASDKSALYTNISDREYFEWIKHNQGVGKTFRIDNKDYLVTSMSFDKVGWIALSVVPLSELTPEVYRQTSAIISFALLAVVLAFVFSKLFISSITRPIQNLADSMASAGQGDLEVSVKVEGDDEIALLSSSFNNMITQISDLLEEIYAQKLSIRQSQLLALQAQINPHFLYNSLESVCSLISQNMANEAHEMVKSLEIFYRTSLSKGTNVTTLENEIANITHYLKIQKTRYYDKMEYFIEYDEALNDYLIINFSLQPIVENAIYHGLRKKTGAGFLRVRCTLTDGIITISVCNDGPEISACSASEALKKGSRDSYGLYNVNERIRLYFGDNYGVLINTAYRNGAMVSVVLPAITEPLEESAL